MNQLKIVSHTGFKENIEPNIMDIFCETITHRYRSDLRLKHRGEFRQAVLLKTIPVQYDKCINFAMYSSRDLKCQIFLSQIPKWHCFDDVPPTLLSFTQVHNIRIG